MVKSGLRTTVFLVVSSSFEWFRVDFEWLRVVRRGYDWLCVVMSGYEWLSAGYRVVTVATWL